MDLEIVIPCYNPPKNWSQQLAEGVVELRKSLAFPIGVILVNDGSTINFNEEIDSLRTQLDQLEVISYSKNKGKGYALRKGVEQAKSKWILLTDIDLPYTLSSMVKMAKNTTAGQGLFLGYRKKDYYQKVPFFRKMLSIAFRVVIKKMLSVGVGDTQCGLKGLDAECQQLFLQTTTNGYLYDLEFVKLCNQKQLSSTRVEVELKDGIEFTNLRFSVLLKEFYNFANILVRV